MEHSKTSRNLTYLLISFVVGIVVLIGLHLTFTSLVGKLDSRAQNLKNRLKIDELLANDVYRIRSSYFELSVTTRSYKGQQLILDKIFEVESQMRNALKILEDGGVLVRRISLNVVGHKSTTLKIAYKNYDSSVPLESIDVLPKLNELNKRIKILEKHLMQRENIFKNSKKTRSSFFNVVRQIRMNNKRAPAFFDRIYENIQRTIYEGNIELEKLKKNSQKSRFFYELLEFVSIILTVILVFIFAYMISKQINKSNKLLWLKVQEEVKKSRQKDKTLLQQSKLAQMGEMISMIAHQWRQPLSAISVTSATIKLKAKLNKLDKDTAMELSDKISHYSQHLSSTIDDFREFFKPNKLKKRVSYEDIIESVLSIVETSIVNKNIKITKELKCNIAFDTYQNELKQVILNLIKNAEDVLLEKKIKDPAIEIKTSANGDELVLEIGDNAGGVPEEILPKIFDPYFSTKTKKDGTGLGLYMSKTIIEKHCGGKLTVANSEQGAVFKITLVKKKRKLSQ